MSKSSTLAILAAAGLAVSGALATGALARAIDPADGLSAGHAVSAAPLLELAANQTGRGTNSNASYNGNDKGKGGVQGNQGNGPNPDRGNAGNRCRGDCDSQGPE